MLPGKVDTDNVAAVKNAAALCEALGHRMEERKPPIEAFEFARDFFFMVCADTGGFMELAGRMRGKPVKYGEVEDLTWLVRLIGRSLSAANYGAARQRLLSQARALVDFFDDCDVMLTPTTGMAPVKIGALVAQGAEALAHKFAAWLSWPLLTPMPGAMEAGITRTFEFAPFTPPMNVTGQPSVNIPLHWNADGLPIGTMFTARLGQDALLLSLAAQLEEAQPWLGRKPPVWAGA